MIKTNTFKIVEILIICILIVATITFAGRFVDEEPTIQIKTEEILPTKEQPPKEVVSAEPQPEKPVFGDDELGCLSLNIYHESRSDSFAGRIAVADVVLNRVDSNLFPDTICDVVNQSVMRTNWKGNTVPVRGMCHFSWYCDGMSDEPMEEGAWEESQIVAEMTLNNGFRGITEGATHYHATYVTPNWINDRGMVPVGRIGEHKFYRWH
jgi:spore germination cell wall hydrolase CwlJ-like protein